MAKLIFGYEKFKDDGDPIDNCIDYVFNDWKICDCGNVFLGMFHKVRHNYLLTSKREWENLLVDTKNINDIKGHYYYVINVREFSAALGIDRPTGKLYDDKHIFKHISPRVIDEVRDNKCKIILNYGYEGFGKKTNGGDTILYKPLLDRLHELLDEYKIPHNNVVYLDSNTILDDIVLDTKINYFFYEYTALDWERLTVMHPDMTYHGNSISQRNMKRWEDSQSKIRKKFFLSFNRLPKQHRVDLVLTLEKHNLLDKGYVSFPKEDDFWKFEAYNGELKPYEDSLFSKLPLKIDNIQLDKKKWSYEKFDNRFYLDSYFQIVTENQFTDYEDQLEFTEKTWKPITNFQPFILLGERYQLKKLREWGFKTFSPFIDESYDEVLDTKERFSMIEIEINKLCNRPIEEIHDWYWSIEQDLRHNYYHFYGKWVREHRNSLLNKLRVELYNSEDFLSEKTFINGVNSGNQSCSHLLREIISDLNGQYFVYHNSDIDAGTNNHTKETWKTRYDRQFIKGREFYVIGSGNDGDYCDDLLIDVDEIYDFFEERDVEKKKIIFLTSNNDLNHGLKTLTETIKTKGARKINTEKWDNLITDIKTEKIESEIPYCPYIFNVGDHPLDYNDLVELSNKNNEPSKLFTTTMWTKKAPYIALFNKFLNSGLIKEEYIFNDNDAGWVSYAHHGRKFEIDKNENLWITNCHNILKEKINDSYINVVVESNIDFTLTNDDIFVYLQKTNQYYRSIMTSSYLTEKTMWPIYLKKPFFIFGGYGSLDALKNYGFKTFDKIFDESYQYESNLYIKVEMIVNQLIELNKKSKGEIEGMVDSVQDIVDYNQKLLLSTSSDKNRISSIYKYITGNIKDILNV